MMVDTWVVRLDWWVAPMAVKTDNSMVVRMEVLMVGKRVAQLAVRLD